MVRLKKNKKKTFRNKRSASAFSLSAASSIAAAIALCVGIFFFFAGTKPDLSNLPFPPVNNTYDMALLAKEVGMAYRREMIKLKNEELDAIKANEEFVACALNTNYGVRALALQFLGSISVLHVHFCNRLNLTTWSEYFPRKQKS